ncbi:CU044_2847 family protein [Nonomuraea sp. NPDC049784]|uniref:CU044_2847 family protein n=1 Tax=Nonomuraea sp. NPDC049784 TaxID=3154361 RepID=UPI0033F0D02F
MRHYVRFTTEDGSPVLLELTENDVPEEQGGIQGAGPGQRAKELVTTAAEALETALVGALQRNARAFMKALEGVEPPPREAQITFGFKWAGELGFTVAKTTSEATYSITLTWNTSLRKPSEEGTAGG